MKTRLPFYLIIGTFAVIIALPTDILPKPTKETTIVDSIQREGKLEIVYCKDDTHAYSLYIPKGVYRESFIEGYCK